MTTVNKIDLMDVVMINMRSTDIPSSTVLRNIIDCYHYIDVLDEKEETKFDLRNAVYNHLMALRKKVSMRERLSIASWLHDVVLWEEDKGAL